MILWLPNFHNGISYTGKMTKPMLVCHQWHPIVPYVKFCQFSVVLNHKNALEIKVEMFKIDNSDLFILLKYIL